MKLLAEITIPQYIRKIITAESRRATHYAEGEKIPKKYSDKLGTEYSWMFIAKKKKKYLVDRDGEFVIKNINVAGKQRIKRINGQDLHALTLQDYERSKIIKAIKAQMIPEVEKLEPITIFPLRILCELHDTYEDYEHLTAKGVPKKIDWDVDNRGLFYCKTLPDVMCGCPYIDAETKTIMYQSKRIIPDDHRRYITQPPVALFCPIENAEERKLVFKIYHDGREIIQNSKFYNL